MPALSSFRSLQPASNPEPEQQEEFSPTVDLRTTLKQNREFVDASKRYMKNVYNQYYRNDDEVVDAMISDRRWKDANTVSLAKELNNVKGIFGKAIADEDLRDLAVIRRTWDQVPGGFTRIGKGIQEGNLEAVGEGLEAIGANVARGIIDPVNLAGGFVGKIGSLAASRAAKVGALAAVDGLISGGFEAATQEVEQDVGLRDKFDWESIVTSGVIGAGVSVPGSYLATGQKGGGMVDITNQKTQDELLAATKGGAKRLTEKYGVDPDVGIFPGQKEIGVGDDIKLKRDIDIDDFDKEVQKVSRKYTADLMPARVYKGEKGVKYDPLMDSIELGDDVAPYQQNLDIIEETIKSRPKSGWEDFDIETDQGPVKAKAIAKSYRDNMDLARRLKECLGQ